MRKKKHWGKSWSKQRGTSMGALCFDIEANDANTSSLFGAKAELFEPGIPPNTSSTP